MTDEARLAGLQPLDLDGFASGRLHSVLIEAPAGFGKTFLLRRTARNLSQGLHTFFVTCNRIPPSVLEPTTPATELLCQVVAEALGPSIANRFRELGEEQKVRLLVLDGLNEIAVQPNAIHRLLYQAQLEDNLLVLASQRPAITRLPPPDYSLGFLLPLKPEFVTSSFGAVDPGAMRLLRIPLFFELRKREGIEATTQVAAVYDYFARCLSGLDQYRDYERLTPQAKAALLAPALRDIGLAGTEIYREKQSTAAEEQFFTTKGLFSEIGGVDAALAAGFVVRDDGLVRFRHQLFHDWAIAKYYFDTATVLDSQQPRTAFDIASLARQSTDSLELLVQMHAQHTSQDAEKVVLKIYDWDYPAAAAALISWIKVAIPNGPLPGPSRHLQVATFSLIAEKGFDLFQHTVRRFDTIRSSVEPVLRNLLPLLPDEYRMVDLVQSVREAALGPGAPEWYEPWVRAFTEAMQFDELLTLLQSGDGALGWTASNVLARSTLPDDRLRDVESLFDSARAETVGSQDRSTTIRWRLVHAVGRTSGAVDFLDRVARSTDIEDDVRYGAVRSLCSIALSNDDSATEESSIGTVSSLDAAGLLGSRRAASAILRCSIPARGITPPSVDYWVQSFRDMLDRHRANLNPTDPDVAMWERRIAEFEEWRRLVDDNDP